MNSTHKPGPDTRYLRPTLWVLLSCLCFWSAYSQAEDADPASRVARVSYLKGQVYVQTADDDGWSTAGINQPLTSSDQLWTDNRGRAELQMGSTAIQVDENTQLRLLELSDDVLQLQVTQGVVTVHVRNLDRNDTVEIDTPNAAVTALEAGTYRIEVADRDDQTIVQVREGRADVAGEKQNFSLRADEQLSLRGSSRLSAEFDQLARMDEFDRWSEERNQRAERVASSRYVAPDVVGYEDLDDYGYWRWYSDYGYVWQPTRIVSGWAPYRYGHWSWVSPWGWTWIDDAPWGFAPFHYGRWASISNRWCWVPGPRTVRAVYAPALVAWIGTPGLSVSVNIGSQPVGWIPLGPREVYRPVYRSSRNYIVNVNLSNSRLDRDEFERGYRRQPHETDYGNRAATSVVPANTLREARAVGGHLITPNNGRLQAITDTPVARPDRNQNQSNERRVVPPVNANSREVLARRQPVQPDSSSNSNATAKPSSVRVIDPTVVRRFGNDNRDDSRNRGDDNANGRGVIAPSNNNNDSNRRSSDSPREQQRDTQRDDAVIPGNRNTRSIITSPYIRPELKNEQRNDLPQSTPAARPSVAPSITNPPAATPTTPTVVEPRERTRTWVRDEAQLGRERNSDSNNSNNNAQPAQRERSITVPNNPAPTQRREQPAQPVQAAPAATPSNSNEAQKSSDENERRRRRQDGDSR